MKGARAAALLAAACCTLVACTSTPSAGDGDASQAAKKSSAGELRPLARVLAVPPGAAPRSWVPSVNYDLTVPGTGGGNLPPDDGVPGGHEPREVFERGGASWYGIGFHNRKTANGERFDMGAFTAAHRTLPFNTRVCVRSLVNGKEVLVRINDRGPYAQGRIIDLSRAAADQIGLTSMGINQVALSVVDRDGIRCGGVTLSRDDALSVSAPVRAVKAVPRRAKKAGRPGRRHR